MSEHRNFKINGEASCSCYECVLNSGMPQPQRHPLYDYDKQQVRVFNCCRQAGGHAKDETCDMWKANQEDDHLCTMGARGCLRKDCMAEYFSEDKE
jgi:hypothetical protein